MSGAAAKKRSGSGNHPAVIAFRKKIDSIAEAVVPALEEINQRLDRALERAAPHDPRREPDDDDRREPSAPVDVVTLDPPPSSHSR